MCGVKSIDLASVLLSDVHLWGTEGGKQAKMPVGFGALSCVVRVHGHRLLEAKG